MADTKIYRMSLKPDVAGRFRTKMQSGMVAVFQNSDDPKVLKGAKREHFVRMTDAEYAEKLSEGVFDIAPATEEEAEAAKTPHQRAYSKPAGSQKPFKGKMPTEPGGVSDVALDPLDVVNPDKAKAAKS